jgi:hypothetical protein
MIEAGAPPYAGLAAVRGAHLYRKIRGPRKEGERNGQRPATLPRMDVAVASRFARASEYRARQRELSRPVCLASSSST